MTSDLSAQKKRLKKKVYPDRKTLLKILDHMYDELYVIDKSGTCVYVNKTSLKHYGIQPEKIIGQNVTESSNQGYFYPPVGPIVLKTEKTATYETMSNTGRNLLVTATPVFDNDNKLEMVVENLRDVTMLNQVKNDLDLTKKLLYRYQREVEVLRKKELEVDFITHSKVMTDILELVRRLAKVNASLLITGQTGTGKTMLAKYIHKQSPHKKGPFIAVNCAAIPDQLMESELYGYASRAFSGADPKGKPGLIELARGGTLLLDEVGEIPLHLQAKMLHMLEEKQYLPVGGSVYKQVQCRFLAATNQPVAQLVDQGKFRSDLYYRLKTLEIDIPPLTERREDVIPLSQYFLNKFDQQYHVDHSFSPEAIEHLIGYSWPGNVRELKHLVEMLVVTTAGSQITSALLPMGFFPTQTRDFQISTQDLALDDTLHTIESQIIRAAYEETGSSYKMARALKISQSRAHRLIKKHVKPALKSSQ